MQPLSTGRARRLEAGSKGDPYKWTMGDSLRLQTEGAPMTDPGKTGRRPKRLTFLLDRRGQVGVACRVVALLAGIGVLYAVAVWFLLGSDLVTEANLGEVRLVFLGLHTLYFVLGGAILLVGTLVLTHRFAGPAYVMRIAVARMRRGEYDVRLTTRETDYHKELSEELRQLRDELVAREQRRAHVLVDLQRSLDQGDTARAAELLQLLRTEAGAVPGDARAEAATPV